MPTLALRLGAARPRRSTTHRNDPGPGDEDDGQRPVDEPEVDVRVLPWVEDDPAWGEWAEGAVKVVVEVAPSEESLGGGGGGGALQVCRMGDYEQASVGIYVRPRPSSSLLSFRSHALSLTHASPPPPSPP